MRVNARHRETFYRVSWSLLFIMMGQASAVMADEIRMKNGDVLTGEIIKKEGDSVTFRTKYAGDINIVWAEIANVSSDKQLDIVLNNRERLNGTLSSTYEEGRAGIQLVDEKAADQEAYEDIELASLRYINPSPELVRGGYKWTGRVNAGGTWAQGNNVYKQVRFDAESILRTLQNRYTVGGVFNRSEDRTSTTAFNSRAYGKYDHFWTEKWYAYAAASGEQDRFRDLQLLLTAGGGSGYQMFESPNLNLSLEGGLAYVMEKRYVEEDKDYPALRWAIKYDQKFFNGFTQFFHEHEALWNMEDTRDLLFTSKTGFRFPLTQRLNASTQLNFLWDGRPADGRKSMDSVLLFNVGYAW